MPTAIQDLISTQSIVSYFQPVVSIKKRAVAGLEAFARGLDGPTRLFSPDQMFEWASKAGVRDELDDLCLRTALETFTRLPNRRALALFLNLDAGRLSLGPIPAQALLRAVESCGLKPQDVILEFNDFDAGRVPGLPALIEHCQSLGFSVALDDLDGSPSSLRRIAELKPNLIKVDDPLVRGIAADPVKQVLMQALASLARRLGALTVAEGVESEEEANMCTELGVDLLQGHHYGHPQPGDKLPLASAKSVIERSAAHVKFKAMGRNESRQRESENHLKMLSRVRQPLDGAAKRMITPTLEQLVNTLISVECLYVIDPMGLQETPTVAWRTTREKERSRLFSPAEPGADHSLKDYFLGLTLGAADTHVSDPYVSLASGNLCRTLTTRFTDAMGAVHILCMDVRSIR